MGPGDKVLPEDGTEPLFPIPLQGPRDANTSLQALLSQGLWARVCDWEGGGAEAAVGLGMANGDSSGTPRSQGRFDVMRGVCVYGN